MPESRGTSAGVRLQAAAERMLAEVGRLPADVIRWQPAWDVWSVMDILCHVQEFIPYWTSQALQVVEHPGEPWGREHGDRDRLAAVTNTSARRLSDVQQAIRRGAAESAAALARLSDAQLSVEAASRNPRIGVKPAQFIVDQLLIEHVEKHIGQIRRNATEYQEKGGRLSEFVFPPVPPASAPIRGRAQRFPIRRIFCVGRNYEGHAREMGAVVDREAPFYFTKAAPHYAPSGSTIAYPPGTSNYHYEMELVAAIGRAGFHVPEAHALEHVFGYACGLDMTRRDLQAAAKDKQRPWDIGKDVEESAVVGEIAPANEIGHVTRGRIELRINGATKQSSDVSLLIHPVAAIIAHLSQYYHLHPGDLIFTGTPEGVGAVSPGDRLEGSIEGVGAIAVQIGLPTSRG
jgi:fumarylpyruvate hydrolase